MKKIFLLLSFFCLSGCIYDGYCWIPVIQTVTHDCGRYPTPYPLIAGYQKKDSIGHTDSRQRIEDVKACGSNESLSSFSDGYEKFSQCMILKGYIRFEPNDCGYQEPEESTGKCNI